MPNIGLSEIIIIAIVLIVLFGGKKIPELVKGITQGVKEVKKGIEDKE